MMAASAIKSQSHVEDELELDVGAAAFNVVVVLLIDVVVVAAAVPGGTAGQRRRCKSRPRKTR